MKEETIKNFWRRRKEIKAISVQIQSMYDTRRSITWDDMHTSSSYRNRSVTEAAVYKIDKLQEDLEELTLKYIQESEEIEKWIRESVPDPTAAAIIRAHFIAGKNWSETSKIIYGYRDPDVCRMYYNRYKVRNKIYENDQTRGER